MGAQMAEAQVTFHNKADIRVQAQVFTGRSLISTCLANSGETHILQTSSTRHDIYLRDATTGMEIARKRDNEAASVVLSQQEGRYILTGS
jgi:hypothetical protein